MMPALLVTRWTRLAVASYVCEPAVLQPYLPRGTELDTLDGQAYVSLVGFEWSRPRLWGVPAPFHERFAELNLRTYVRQTVGAQTRLGVVFLKELVGKPAIAWTGRDLFHENFTLMRVEVDSDACQSPAPAPETFIAYRWFHAGRWESLRLDLAGASSPAVPSAFFLERGWAYTATRDGHTLAYPVERASGRVRDAANVTLAADVPKLFGPAFSAALSAPPASASLAEGSSVRVGRGERIT